MRRLIVLAVLAGLLLCGCGEAAPLPTQTPAQTTGTPTAPSTQPTAEPTTQTTAAPTEAPPVTVYLLDKIVIFDSGYMQFAYDENHNIDSYDIFTIENDIMCRTFFEEKDANGMAGTVRLQWPDGSGEIQKLTYSPDGKLQEKVYEGSEYTGNQYEYDAQGNLTQRREYYDGILQTVVYCEYDGGMLTAARCEDTGGNPIFRCRIENGLVMEKNFTDSYAEYTCRYEYDENRNPVRTVVYYDGEETPGELFYFVEVEVEADRAPYLLEQQTYLLAII